MESPAPLTELLDRWRAGESDARDRVFDSVYPELRRIAARQLSGHRRSLTLDTGALVNEACERLLGAALAENGTHLRAIAATAMRQIVIDHARKQLAASRGAGVMPLSLDEQQAVLVDGYTPEQVLAAEERLQRLAELGERFIQIVECRFFAGFTEEETAQALGLSRRTVQREWRRAQAWLAVGGGA